ncbi:NAD-dependent epimerase/dehydratase family protein [Leucobacter soli]|uniref:NAD-dependent epimerase/dehydratase family protein n=1 Tax=Leucobacter soli TaxID=2812850 RepID=UPI00360D9CE9
MTTHIVIAGASGLIGRALSRAIVARGDRVTALVRRPAQAPGEAPWEPARGTLDIRHLEGADAVVVLNGASVGRMPWTKAYRQELIGSRIAPVSTVATALARMGSDAPTLVSGSAVGYYGSAPGAVLTEAAVAGDTFLARLCVDWEAAAREAESVTRVALLRTAPVIHRAGVLRPMIRLTSSASADRWARAPRSGRGFPSRTRSAPFSTSSTPTFPGPSTSAAPSRRPRTRPAAPSPGNCIAHTGCAPPSGAQPRTG